MQRNFFGIRNDSSTPGRIVSIFVDENSTGENDDVADNITALDVTVGGISVGQPIGAGGEVMGNLAIHVEQAATQNWVYTIRVKIVIVGVGIEKCDTAYAYGGTEYATCFIGISEIPKTSNWGWTNGPLEPGFYGEFPLYAGASGCDISGGELAGTVTIDYDGSTVTVTYNLYEGYTMDVTHLYVGSERLPRNKQGKYTVSPGQYPYQHTHDPVDSTTYTYTIDGLSGDIYVIAHAVPYWFE